MADINPFSIEVKGFAEFNAMVDYCDQEMTRLILGSFSESGGILYQGGEPVGTTRPGPKDNRLRRFVRRGGQVVEVRARGRGGQRGLQAAANV